MVILPHELIDLNSRIAIEFSSASKLSFGE